MRPHLACVILVTVMSAAAWGVVYTGTYELRHDSVTITLVLQQDAAGNVTGTLRSTTGMQYRVEGMVEPGEEVAVGACSGPDSAVYFEAHLQGDTLLLALIEATPGTNAPDYDKMRQLTLNRVRGATGPPAPPPGQAVPRVPVPSVPVPTVPGTRAPAPPPPAGRAAPPPPAANEAQRVTDPELGLSFVPPSGWMAQKQGGGYLLGSNTHAGFIVMLPHQFRSLSEVQAAAGEGFVDEQQGIQLLPAGPFQPLGGNAVGAEFNGLIQGQSARAYAAAVLSPQGGGVTLIAATTAAAYSAAYAGFVRELAGSVRFVPRAAGAGGGGSDASLAQWIAGKYYSYSGGSTLSGGSGTERQVMFCPDGTFYSATESGSYGTGSWGVAGQSSNRARFTIRGDRQSGVIILQWQDGSTDEYRYQVTGESGVILFNGIKFAYAGAPECG